MKCIVNTTENWGIGNENRLLVRIPADMKWFRSQTEGKIVVMGRKTLDSFPGSRPLKNRINIVITRNKNYVPQQNEGSTVVLVNSMEMALEAIKDIVKLYSKPAEGSNESKTLTEDDVFVIGGGTIYRLFMPYIDTAIVTRVKTTLPADSYFPNLDEDEEWQVAEQSEENEYEGMKYKFVTYKRKV